MKNIIFISTIFILIFVSESLGFDANITVNPGCAKNGLHCDENVWLVEALSGTQNHSVQYLWGMVGAPVLVLATSEVPQNQVKVNWPKLQNKDDNSGSIEFEFEPESLFVVTFPTLILFNDTEDTGKFDKGDEHFNFTMEDFTWTVQNASKSDIIIFTSHYKNVPMNDGNITLKLTVFDDFGRSSVLPKLLTTPETSQFELTFDNLTMDFTNSSSLKDSKSTVKPISGFSQPRWAIQMVLFTDDPESDFKMNSRKSLDDEYSPGVFHLNDLTTADKTNDEGGYLQWRPIGYRSRARDMNNSTNPNVAPLQNEMSNFSSIKKSLIHAICGDNIVDLSVTNTVISFGQPKDGFYTDTDFVMWVATMGYGTPPKESFSVVVMIVIALGVGIPSLMFLVGGVVIFVKRRRNQSRDLLID